MKTVQRGWQGWLSFGLAASCFAGACLMTPALEAKSKKGSVNGTYEANGPFKYKLGSTKTSGTHSGNLKVKGTKLTGKTNASDGCRSIYNMTIKGGAKLGKNRKLKGSMLDKCDDGNTTYTVDSGNLQIKTNGKGDQVMKSKIKMQYSSGVNPGSKLTNRYTGTKK